MNYAIEVEGLTKIYNGRAVLNEVSLRVEKGEIFAVLGVNGAGKTTMLECIEKLRKCDKGTITVRGSVGIQLQSASLPEHIKAMEAIHLFAKWNRCKCDCEMLSSLGIDELAKKQYGRMSTGQKRRLHLAIALLTDPDIVFLDEPTAGLDVEGRISLHEEIRKLKAKGKTIILASHDMAEVEALCDRIAILKDGGFVFVGSVDELGEKIGRHFSITIKTKKGDEEILTDNVSDALLNILEEYKKERVEVLDVKIDRGTLEQHFIDIARGKEE